MTTRRVYSWASIWIGVTLVGLCALWGYRLRAENVRFANETELLRNALDQSSTAIAIGDSDGLAIFHNHAFCEMMGWSTEEINRHGGTRYVFVNKEQFQEIDAKLRARQPYVGYVELRRPDDTILFVYLQAVSLLRNDNEYIGVVGLHEMRPLQASTR